MDLNSFIRWQAEDKARSVKIDIQTAGGVQDVHIWVWDANLMEGQYVKSVEEIDIQGVVERKERREWEKLHKKYGSGLDSDKVKL